MIQTPQGRYLTVNEASERVDRSRRTIETWITEGLTVRYLGTRKRFVREDELLLAFRTKLASRSKYKRLVAGVADHRSDAPK